VSLESINKTIQRLVLSPYHQEGFEEREQQMFTRLGFTPVKEAGQVLISNTLFDFSKADPTLFENVELIIHPNSGYDNFPVEFVQTADFPIVVGNPIRAEGVAEYSLASLFQNFASIPYHQEWQPGRHWNRPLLSELKILIVGAGHIGKIIEQSLRALGTRPDVFDPDKGRNDLEGQYDAVLMACSLNPTSFHFVDQDFLQRHMKTSGCLINGARGKLVDQKALLAFASSHPEFHAWLDVFEKEPEGLRDFSKASNITTTSHIAGVSQGLDDLMIDFEEKILTLWREGRDLNESCPELLLQKRLRKLESDHFLI
jgi:D-3-phosphoglycerate dehydrogenase